MTHKLPSFFLLFYCSGEKMRNWFPLEHVRDDWKGNEIWIVDFEKYLYYKENEQDADNLATGLSSCTKLTKLSIREDIRNFNHLHTHLMPLSSSSLPQNGQTIFCQARSCYFCKKCIIFALNSNLPIKFSTLYNIYHVIVHSLPKKHCFCPRSA